MDKRIKTIFGKATDAWGTFKEREQEALSSYRSEMGKAKAAASAYKDEQSYVKEHQEQLARDARAEIAAAEKEFCSTIHDEVVPALRAELAEYLTAKPDRDFMDTMGFYNTFNIAMDEAEVRALSYDTAGNYMQLRALAAVAEKSGISVRFPSVAEYGKVIDRLERMAQQPMMFAPSEYLHEAIEVLPDKPLRRADGTQYGTTGRPDSVYLLMQQQSTESIMKAVAEAGDTWSAAVVPEISEYRPYKNEDTGEEVTSAEQRAQDKLTAAQQVETDTREAEKIAAAVTAEQVRAAASYSDFEKYYLR